jgi:hypothetical protein
MTAKHVKLGMHIDHTYTNNYKSFQGYVQQI